MPDHIPPLITILLISIKGQQKPLFVLCRVPSSPWHLLFTLKCIQCFPVRWKSDCPRCDPCSGSLNPLLLCNTLLEMRGAELHRVLKCRKSPGSVFWFVSHSILLSLKFIKSFRNSSKPVPAFTTQTLYLLAYFLIFLLTLF